MRFTKALIVTASIFLLALVVFIEASIKNAFSKDISEKRTHIIKDMQNKVASLESSMKHVSAGIKHVESQERSMKSSLDEQYPTLERLRSDFESLEQTLLKYKHNLTEFERMVYAGQNENLFVFSNNKCGEALLAQSGYLSFSQRRYVVETPAFTDGYLYRELRPVSCIWSIRAYSKTLIKLLTRSLGFSSENGDGNLTVIEIFTENEGSIRPLPIKIKTTRLSPQTTYLFHGPLIFLVLSNPGRPKYLVQRYAPSLPIFNIQVEFQGVGVDGYEDISFKNESLLSPYWSTRNVDGNASRESDQSKWKWEVTSVVSNYTGRAWLRLGKCGTESSLFTFHDSTLSDNITFQNNCKSGGEDIIFLESFAKSFLGLIIIKPRNDPPFSLSLLTEPNYPSSFNQKCGGILSGGTGSIKYTLRQSNPTRCIWAFVPPSTSKQRIRLHYSLSPSNLPGSVRVYFIEMADSNGTLFDSPSIHTPSRAVELIPGQNIFAVFESSGILDTTSQINVELNLIWLGLSDQLNETVIRRSRNSYSTFEHLSDIEGSIEVQNPLEMFPHLEANLLLVFTPATFMKTMSFNETLTLQLNFHASIENKTMIRVLSPSERDGFLRANNDVKRHQNGTIEINDADGLVMIAVPKESLFSGSVSYKWMKEATSIPEVGDGTCGGVITGTRGFINFKNGVNTRISANCIWLLNAPNSSSITFKLRNDGFSDHLKASDDEKSQALVISSIDAIRGTINNDTRGLSTNERICSFNASLLVVHFKFPQVDHRGFLLQFMASPEVEMREDAAPDENHTVGTSDIYIDLQHFNFNSSAGDFTTEVDYESLHSTENQLRIYAFSYENNATLGSYVKTHISWKRGLFKRYENDPSNNCSFDTVRLFVFSGHGNLWQEQMHYPKISSEECPNEFKLEEESQETAHSLNFNLTMDASAFLVIYKVLPVSVGEEDDNGDKRGFEFTHRTNITDREDLDDEQEKVLRHILYMHLRRRYPERGAMWALRLAFNDTLI